MKTRHKTTISRAQQEVWDCKAAAWAEVAHLNLKDAIRERLRRSAETAAALGFAPATAKRTARRTRPASLHESASR